MLFFDMPDFVGNDRIDLFGFKHVKKTLGNKDVAEFLNQPHYGCGDHLSTENGPGKNVGIFQSGFSAELFNPTSMVSNFKGLTSPEFLNQRRTYYRNGQQKN